MITEMTRNYTTVEIPKELHRALKEVALERNKPVKTILIDIVRDFFINIHKNNLTQVTN